MITGADVAAFSIRPAGARAHRAIAEIVGAGDGVLAEVVPLAAGLAARVALLAGRGGGGGRPFAIVGLDGRTLAILARGPCGGELRSAGGELVAAIRRDGERVVVESAGRELMSLRARAGLRGAVLLDLAGVPVGTLSVRGTATATESTVTVDQDVDRAQRAALELVGLASALGCLDGPA